MLNTEIFYTLKEAQVLIEQWRRLSVITKLILAPEEGIEPPT